MRALVVVLALAGCGPVRLGQRAPSDSDTPSSEDAGMMGESSVRASVGVGVAGCEGCFELAASAEGGKSPYEFAWADGPTGMRRTVCPDDGLAEVTVVATDADDVASEPHSTRLSFPDASCPLPPPLLKLDNTSFEGVPAYNDGNPGNFDGEPWSQCTNPVRLNSPDIVDDSLEQEIAEVPEVTDGKTCLGLQEGEQVSQQLEEPLEAGQHYFLELDLQRLYIGAGLAPDTELPFLQVWAGTFADCTQRELLWASKPLAPNWEHYCMKLSPQQYADQITLRAATDESLPTVTYLLVDNLVPVPSCP